MGLTISGSVGQVTTKLQGRDTNITANVTTRESAGCLNDARHCVQSRHVILFLLPSNAQLVGEMGREFVSCDSTRRALATGPE